MSGPRIVATPDGPELRIPAGPAAQLAAVLGRYEALRPAGNGADSVLRALRRLLVEVERRHTHGEGFADEPSHGGRVVSWVTAAEVAASRGVSAKTVRRDLRLGRYPSAFQWSGWLIPAEALPDQEDTSDDEQDGDAA